MTEAQLRAHRALLHAAEQVGANNFRNGLYRSKRGQPYSITFEHRSLIDGSSDVLAGKMSVNDAMALVTSHDVIQQRFGVSN